MGYHVRVNEQNLEEQLAVLGAHIAEDRAVHGDFHTREPPQVLLPSVLIAVLQEPEGRRVAGMARIAESVREEAAKTHVLWR